MGKTEMGMTATGMKLASLKCAVRDGQWLLCARAQVGGRHLLILLREAMKWPLAFTVL